MRLRPYQSKAIDDILVAFEQGHRSVLYTLPTAGGKTVVFADIARRCAEHGTRVAILVHRDSLLTQASQKVSDCGLPYSIVAPGRKFFGDMVCVASKDTLVRRLGQYEFNLLIVDEAHRAPAPTYRKIFDAYPDARILGVTATPCRTNGEGLDSVFSALVRGPGIRALIDAGYLAEPVTYGPLKKLDLSGIRTVAGDYDHHQLADFMDRPRVTGSAIAEYKRLCWGQPAMAFCVSVRHAEDVAAEFREAGFRSYHVSGDMPLDVIRDRISGLSDGRVQVMASCDLASEGLDVPAVRASILLRPTKSLIVYLQQAGRALRVSPGKKDALILDHSGSFARFGLVDEERDWTLEGRKKRAGAAGEAAAPVRQCPKCYVAHRPMPVCPACGHVYEIEARQPEKESGELVKIDAVALRRARKKEEREARTYRELQDLAKRRGYSIAWPLRKWTERGGDPAKAC